MTVEHGGGAVAAQLAAMPGVWRRLLEVHVPDRLGRCEGCPTAGGSGALWPCTLHAAASEAQRLDGRRRQDQRPQDQRPQDQGLQERGQARGA